jgi:uncharacterized delta-60 repeat protein
MRLNVNGSLDSSFSGDGSTFVNLDNGAELATSVILDGDDILMGGFSSTNGGQVLVARLQSNGSLDSTFSGDGLATVDFNPNAEEYAWRLAVQEDGSVVAAGWAAGQGGRISVARLTSAGVLDTTFSGDGKLTKNLTAGDDMAHSVAIDGEGNIVVSGFADGSSSASRIAILRYLGT